MRADAISVRLLIPPQSPPLSWPDHPRKVSAVAASLIYEVFRNRQSSVPSAARTPFEGSKMAGPARPKFHRVSSPQGATILSKKETRAKTAPSPRAPFRTKTECLNVANDALLFSQPARRKHRQDHPRRDMRFRRVFSVIDATSQVCHVENR